MSEPTLHKQLTSLMDRCRQAGLKLTHQRLEVYRELASTTDHPSAETIHQRVRKRVPTISLDTVYRTLAVLEEIGAVRRVDVFDDRARFDADVSRHHHFICHQCGSLLDFHWRDFDALELPAGALACGRITAKQVILRGTCRVCQEAQG